MKKKLILTIMVPLLGLIGCTHQTPYGQYKAGQPLSNYPYKAGTTPSHVNKAVIDCQIEAVQRVPQQIVLQTTPSYTSPVQTQCNRIGTQTFCNSTGGNTYGGETYSTDANVGLRIAAYGQCMASKGYRFVNIPACPAGTTPANLDKSNVLLPLSRNTCYFATPSNNIAIGNLGE